MGFGGLGVGCAGGEDGEDAGVIGLNCWWWRWLRLPVASDWIGGGG